MPNPPTTSVSAKLKRQSFPPLITLLLPIYSSTVPLSSPHAPFSPSSVQRLLDAQGQFLWNFLMGCPIHSCFSALSLGLDAHLHIDIRWMSRATIHPSSAQNSPFPLPHSNGCYWPSDALTEIWSAHPVLVLQLLHNTLHFYSAKHASF